MNINQRPLEALFMVRCQRSNQNQPVGVEIKTSHFFF
jgi:hypothetical protein